MRALVIDDERLARKELISMLNNYAHINVIGEANNAELAIKKIEDLRPDLIFLDIQMPDMNGFEMLNELDYMPQVIFVTAYDEFALRAFEVSALDYLLKPVEESRLEKALEGIILEETGHSSSGKTFEKEFLGSNNQIFIKDGDNCWFVNLGEVSKFESIGNYVRVHFRDEKPMILKSLNKLEGRLNPNVFFRANRKYIINLEWIKDIENLYNGGLKVKLREGSEIEISRRQSSKFKNALSL